ncbi:hypothetical protein [Streptacidiphilus carbonis]|uniref:hypothetical protein n=1 Tax=Streptacidiphilus carbonis TaxID=105422 RepID=UPI0005AB68F8|nr:hypothetical protein [Streptacidiphilus carbonis]
MPRRDRTSASRDPLPGYLAGLDHGALVRLLLEAAAEAPALGERLRSAAVLAALHAAGSDPGAAEAAVRAALQPVAPLDAARTRLYAEQAAAVVGFLGQTLAEGGAGLAVRLAQQAIEQLGAVTPQAEDSAGKLREAAVNLAELHREASLDASLKGCSDPEELAGWLAERHLTADQDVPYAIDAYAEILGDRGLDAYNSALSAAFDRSAPGERRALARRLEAVHTLRGDTDALVAVLATDLGHPSRHLRIAALLAAAGRVPEALEWAERGLALAPSGRGPDAPLLAFVAEHYPVVGRGDEAVALLREQFQRRPDHDAYRALVAALPPEAAAGQRTWALAELNRRAARPTTRSWENPASPLIEFLLADGDPDAAWAAARQYGVPHRALLRLAELRADTHPADAIPVYRQEIDEQIDQQTRDSFRAAATWTARLRDLYRTLGTPEEAVRVIAELRATHSTKGSLLAELDAHGL